MLKGNPPAALRSANLPLASGVIGRPSLRFLKEPTTGIRRSGAGHIAVDVLGTQVIDIAQAGFYARAVGTGSISSMAMGRVSASAADGNETSFDVLESANQVVGRLSVFRQSGATSYGWKLYSYNASALNATPGFILNAANDVTLAHDLTVGHTVFATSVSSSGAGSFGSVSGGTVFSTGTISNGGGGFAIVGSSSISSGNLSVSGQVSGSSISSSGTIAASNTISNTGGGLSITGNGSFSGTLHSGGQISTSSGGFAVSGGSSIVQSANSGGGGLRVYRADSAQFLDFFQGGDNRFYMQSSTGHYITMYNAAAGGEPVLAPGGNNTWSLGEPSNKWDAIYTNVFSGSTIGLSTDTAAKTATSTWQVASDRRTKRPDSIRPYTHGLKQLMDLEPVWFRYNGKLGTVDDGQEHVGFIAQHLLKVAPSMVHDPEADVLAVNLHELFFTLTVACQELGHRVQDLEQKVSAA